MPTAHRPLDFRSDTLTKPTAGMRAAMAAAEVGDDVFNEDPTVLRLQARLAELLGKEASLLVPSGTMSNQICVRLHCGPGDEFLCEAGCHIFNYEQAAYAQLSGVAVQPVKGAFGLLRLEQLTGLIRTDSEHQTHTRMVALEITHNRGAGRIQPLASVAEMCAWAHAHGLATHLDGARLFNAVVATGTAATEWARHFDTVSVCFSKGLGAPIGSALAGTREIDRPSSPASKTIRRGNASGRRARRRGGVLPWTTMSSDMAEDHANARRLAATIREIDGLKLRPSRSTRTSSYSKSPQTWERRPS